MGHEKYILEGFILDSSNFGESGRILKILTKELGIVTLTATGVRELQSKMRGSMDVLQLVNFEYVEGHEMNRLIGIHEKAKFENILTGENFIQKRKVISNVVNFLLRAVVGETSNEKLWDSFLSGIRLLSDSKQLSPSVEILWLIQILISLGYWESGKLEGFTEENFKELEDTDFKTKIIEEINQAIKSTHL
jgi:DNA repair protein RecO